MKNKLREDQTELILDLYNNKYEGYVKISKMLNVSSCSILNLLKKHNVYIRSTSETKAKQSGIDEHFLDDPQEEFAAYFIGLFLSDGNMSSRLTNKARTVSISLHLDDIDLLYQICDKINIDRKYIGLSKRSKLARICFSNKIIYEKLLQIGLTPNKSLTCTIPKILENNRHFWRGVIDGDGTIGYTRKNGEEIRDLGLAGTKQVCEKFGEFIETLYKENSYTIAPCKNIFVIKVNRLAAKDVLTEMYRDCSIYMDRKYQFFLRNWKDYEIGLTGQAIGSNNKTGVIGVSFSQNYYQAVLIYKGVRHYLGKYKNKDDAVAARLAAEKKYIQNKN